MRVLITGSRDWDIEELIWIDLWRIAAKRLAGETLTIMHGDCPTGADAIARRWCVSQTPHFKRIKDVEIIEERYPAEWELYGKRAGFKRNAEMVALKPNLCLAYIKNQSKGATHTARLALEAGIRLHVAVA